MMINGTSAPQQNGKEDECQNGHPSGRILHPDYRYEGTAEVTGRDSRDSMYAVHFSDGMTQRYPFVWLKDNCRCRQCYNSYGQRTLPMATLDLEPKPISEEISADGQLLLVTWADDHVAEYPLYWLHQQRFDKGNYDPILEHKPTLWGKELLSNIPTFQFDEVLNNDDAMLAWMEALLTTGLAKLTGAPLEKGVVKTIAEKVAFLRQTIYGSTFQVYQEYEQHKKENIGFNLGMHTDLSSSLQVPGVQMLHCIRQFKGEGAINEFADAFKAADILKKTDPKSYHLLTTVKMHFRSIATSQFRSRDQLDFYQLVARPIFELDDSGEVRQVYYGDLLRAPCMAVPVEQVQDVYRAIKKFYDTLMDIHFTYKLEEGEIVTFNNTRVMHGRTAFRMDQPGQFRHYEGAYLGWDEVYSKMRVIMKRKKIDMCM